MTEKPSLTVWLSACLDDDEAAAKAAGGAAWTFYNAWGTSVGSEAGTVVYDEGSPTEAQAAHIARHDPARVLAEVAAKRRIIAEHGVDDYGGGYCRVCADPPAYDAAWRTSPCLTVRLLALPYASRDGYQDSWRPE